VHAADLQLGSTVGLHSSLKNSTVADGGITNDGVHAADLQYNWHSAVGTIWLGSTVGQESSTVADGGVADDGVHTADVQVTAEGEEMTVKVRAC
jgi:hypothetical protein